VTQTSVSTKAKSSVQISYLELNVPFQHKYGNIRDERSGVESYTVKKGQRYIPWPPFCSAVSQKGKGIQRLVLIILLRYRLQQDGTTITPQDKTKSNTTETSMHP